MFGDALVAAIATVHAFFRGSINASRLVAAAVGVGSPFGIATVVDAPNYVFFLFGAGVGLATYYVLHYPVRYYDPLAGASVNWDAIAVAGLLFAYLLPTGADAGIAVALAVAIVGLWVAVVAMARLDVHEPPKWYNGARRDDEPEPSPHVERAVTWLAATPPLRAVRSMRDACLDRLRADRVLAWWVGAAASGVGFLTAAFAFDLPDAVPWAFLLGLAPLAYYGTSPDVPTISESWQRGAVRTVLVLNAADADAPVSTGVASVLAFAVLLYGVTGAEQVRVAGAFDEGDSGNGGENGEERSDDDADRAVPVDRGSKGTTRPRDGVDGD